MLFLRLFKKISKDLLFYPFYISFRKINRLLKSSKDHLDTALYPALDRFIEICQAAPEITPILFIDDLTDYDWGADSHSQHPHLDYEIEEYLSASSISSRIKYVVSVDQGFLENPARTRAHLPFHNAGYHCVVKTVPLPVSNRQLLRDILVRYREIYKGSSATVDSFMKQLTALRFNTLDLSQIRVLDRLLQTKTVAVSVSDLYQSECERRLHISANEFGATAAYAYEYAYGKRILAEDQYTAHVRELMYHHKSFIEYLVAVHYLNSLEDVSSIQPIHNVVLPKDITYFVVDILRTNLHKEQSVLNFSKAYYHQLEIHGKSQIAYLLGRVTHPSYTKDAIDQLIDWYQQESKMLHTLDSSSPQYRQQLFLLRSISVSLIYMGMGKYAELYLESLISNDTANDINRGFHLEYYGDISYNPTLLILEYRDDPTRGNISIKQLIHYLNISQQAPTILPSFDLNLFSLCSLLQARCYTWDPRTLNVHPYLPDAIRLLERRLDRAQKPCPKVMHYFRFILWDFKRMLKQEQAEASSISTMLYNNLSKAETVLRKGWVNRGIPNPENIVEHSFSAWKIGLFFLPAKYHDPTYSKQAVLDMLLIHDLGEVFVGDVTPDQDSPEHRCEEDTCMRNIFLFGTHPKAANLTHYYDLWNEWAQQYTLSSKIAKEIDQIQCCYRLCMYYLQHPGLLSEKEVLEWIKAYHFKTEIGLNILSQLIHNNPEFFTIFHQ